MVDVRLDHRGIAARGFPIFEPVLYSSLKQRVVEASNQFRRQTGYARCGMPYGQEPGCCRSE